MKLAIGIACFLTVCVHHHFAAPASGNQVNAGDQDKKISSSVIDLMARLGYYEKPDLKLGQIANPEDIKTSLMEMQQFAGLTPSGIMDADTVELLKTPRCGMADITSSMRNVKRKRRYTLQGTSWRKQDLTWKLTNDNNDGLSRDQVEAVMTTAFGKWSAVTNLNFRKLDLSSTEKVDIEVKFVTYSHGDPYPFDGQGGTLAHAFYPHNNEGLSGDVHFDDDEEYTINSPRGRSLLWVAVHEIGHSIGLEHSNLQSAVMYPWYRGNGGKDFPLNEDDIIGVQNIYGGKAVDPEDRTTTSTTTTTRRTPKTDATPAITKSPVTATLPKAGPSCPTDFKAAFLDARTQKTFIINNDKAYIMSKSLGIEEGPVTVDSLFRGVRSADALYQRRDGNIVVFSGRWYYIYDDVKGRRIEDGLIQSKYGVNSDVERIDAAFIWNRNGRLYLFAGEDYYRFDDERQNLDRYYPKRILGNWKGLPASIDGAVVWRNKVSYFFKDKQYYRFNDQDIQVEKGYPKPIHPIWTKCSINSLKEDGQTENASATTLGSMVMSVAMVLVVKLLQ